jgi:hypothetical protein
LSYETKDSGQREVFDTGMQRDSQESKGRFDLVPFEALLRLAQLYERGAVKYDANNWRKGQPFSRAANSMLRHANEAVAGYSDEDHLAAVVFNAMALMSYQEMIKRGELDESLNDLPKRDPSESPLP